MVSTPSEGNWAVTFPGNLRWSNAMQIVKGMVPYAASAMAEIDNVRIRLTARAGEPNLDMVWKEEWEREGDRVTIRERIRMTAKDAWEDEITVTDPVALTKPWIVTPPST